jgi:hypothetical protein
MRAPGGQGLCGGDAAPAISLGGAYPASVTPGSFRRVPGAPHADRPPPARPRAPAARKIGAARRPRRALAAPSPHAGRRGPHGGGGARAAGGRPAARALDSTPRDRPGNPGASAYRAIKRRPPPLLRPPCALPAPSPRPPLALPARRAATNLLQPLVAVRPATQGVAVAGWRPRTAPARPGCRARRGGGGGGVRAFMAPPPRRRRPQPGRLGPRRCR